MKKCTIFGSNPEYVRTANFLKYTKSVFKHVCPTPFGERIFGLRQLNKIRKIRTLARKNLLGEYVYIQGLDPILLSMCRRYGIKVITDVLEPFPEAEGYRRSFYLSMIEKYVVSNSDLVLTVCDEEKYNLVRKYGHKNIVTVKNFADIDVYKPTRSKFNDFSIVYFGSFRPSRSLEYVTLAIAQLQKEFNIEFHVIGPEELSSQIKCSIVYHGYLDRRSAAKIIGRCQVGIAPYVNNLHCNLTLQNKSFEYAACNTLPISTKLEPLKKYSKLIDLVQNTEESWYRKLLDSYWSWNSEKMRFNQREVLIKNKWTAKDEWDKFVKCIGGLK